MAPSPPPTASSGPAATSATVADAQAAQDDLTSKYSQVEEIAPFPPEKEAAMLEQVNTHKANANMLFTSSQYNAANLGYDEALTNCPKYLYYDLAVLMSNAAACHLKLEQWQEAIKSATESLDALTKEEKKIEESEARQMKGDKGTDDNEDEKDSMSKSSDNPQDEDDSDVEEEIVSEGATKAGPTLVKKEPQTTAMMDRAEAMKKEEEKKKKRKDDINRIRTKSFIRRARGRTEVGGWQNLSAAEEDYKTLAAMDTLGSIDRKTVLTQLRLLEPRVKAAREEETAKMWGQLKQLGNGLLKPLGLSTDNFQYKLDEKTGGYTMNFNGNPNP